MATCGRTRSWGRRPAVGEEVTARNCTCDTRPAEAPSGPMEARNIGAGYYENRILSTSVSVSWCFPNYLYNISVNIRVILRLIFM